MNILLHCEALGFKNENVIPKRKLFYDFNEVFCILRIT